MTTLAEPISVTDRILAGDFQAETELLRNYLRGAAVLAVQHGLPQESACEAASVVVERIRNGEVRANSQIASAVREAVVLLSGRLRRADSQHVYLARKQAAGVCRRVLDGIPDYKQRAMIYRLFAGGLTPEQVSGELELKPEELRAWLRAAIERFRVEDGGEPLVGNCDAGPAAAPRYVLDQLTPVETALFEEHYTGCECCAEFVMTASRLRSGMPIAAAEEAGDLARREPIRLLAARWLSRRSYWGQASALVAASVFLTLGPSAYLLSNKKEQAPASPAAEKRRTVARPAATSAKKEVEVKKEAEVKRESPSVKASPFIPPPPSASVGAAPAATPGVAVLQASTDWAPKSTVKITDKPVVLQVDRSADKESASYIASVYSQAGRPVQWELDLKPSAAGLVTMTVAPEKLNGQIFSLVLEGIDGRGQHQPPAKYSFQVAR